MRSIWVLLNLVFSVWIVSIPILAIGWLDRNKNITGKLAERSLEEAGITVNKNMVPFDQRSPFITSGIRVGTPAITTRGMAENEMNQIVDKIDQVISDIDNDITINRVKMEVKSLCESFPLYRELHD